MAVLEEGLVTYLKTVAGLTALISTRIYAFAIPQEATLPCVTYQRISTPRYPSHDTSGASGNLSRPRVQFDAWATTYSSAKAITDQLRAALNGKKGSTGGVTLQGALVVEEAPTYEPETKLYRSRSDYFIWILD